MHRFIFTKVTRFTGASFPPKVLAKKNFGKVMKFLFRANMQLCAGPTQKPAAGFRATSLHASSIAEAAERFMRDQLSRKRDKTLCR